MDVDVELVWVATRRVDGERPLHWRIDLENVCAVTLPLSTKIGALVSNSQ